MFLGYSGIGGASSLSGRTLRDRIGGDHTTAAANKAMAAERDVSSLEDRIDELALACAAMWELLESKTSLTHEDLFAKIREIDLRDGTADGKVTRTVKQCPSCGRTMSRRHNKCLYCGALELKETPFDGI